MSNINVREYLNKLDSKTDNKYDLLNLYESHNLSDSQKISLIEMINKKSSAKTLNRFLESCADDEQKSYLRQLNKEIADLHKERAKATTYDEYDKADLEIAKKAKMYFDNGGGRELDEDLEDDVPSSAEEIEKDLKSITKDFTEESGVVKCAYKEESLDAEDILRQHYSKVNVSKSGRWFKLTYSQPINRAENKSLKENDTTNNSLDDAQSSSIDTFMNTPIEKLDPKIIKAAFDDYSQEYAKLPKGMDAITVGNEKIQGEFYNKYYEFAKRCREVSNSKHFNVSGYGRSDYFILKARDMCKRVDYTFPYGAKRYAHSTMTESVEENKDTDSLIKEFSQYMRDNNFDYTAYPTFNDGEFQVDITWGDWKHDHIYLQHLATEFFGKKGISIEHMQETTEEDGSDTYSATHTFKITGENKTVIWVKAKGEETYIPFKEINGNATYNDYVEIEDAFRAETGKEVEGISMLPKGMNPDGIIELPLYEDTTEKDLDEDGLLGGDINLNINASGSSVGFLGGKASTSNESLLGDVNVNIDGSNSAVGFLSGNAQTTNEVYQDDLKVINESSDAFIELNYDDLDVIIYGPQRDVDDWDEENITIDYVYKVDKDDIITTLIEDCINTEDRADWFDIDDELAYRWVVDNFNMLFNKYKDKILEIYKDQAQEDAQEWANENYDPDDYIDYDYMPGGYHDIHDIAEGYENEVANILKSKKSNNNLKYLSSNGTSGEIEYKGTKYAYAKRNDGSYKVMTSAAAGNNWSETLFKDLDESYNSEVTIIPYSEFKYMYDPLHDDIYEEDRINSIIARALGVKPKNIDNMVIVIDATDEYSPDWLNYDSRNHIKGILATLYTIDDIKLVTEPVNGIHRLWFANETCAQKYIDSVKETLDSDSSVVESFDEGDRFKKFEARIHAVKTLDELDELETEIKSNPILDADDEYNLRFVLRDKYRELSERKSNF